MTRQSRYRGALLGLAAGDALGTTIEFECPGSFTPLTDIVGGGPVDEREIGAVDGQGKPEPAGDAMKRPPFLDEVRPIGRRAERWHVHGPRDRKALDRRRHHRVRVFRSLHEAAQVAGALCDAPCEPRACSSADDFAISAQEPKLFQCLDSENLQREKMSDGQARR